MVMNVCHMVSRTLSLLKIEGAKQFKEMKKKLYAKILQSVEMTLMLQLA